jgi:hypothetical protein
MQRVEPRALAGSVGGRVGAVTCYCYLLHVTCYLLPVTCYLLLLPVTDTCY